MEILNFELPRIYPITDTRISGISHAEQAKRLIAGGARLIELREKHAASLEFYLSAEEVIRIAEANNVAVLINDRVDVALAVGAAGVHLGQDDMPPEKAREILGKDAIIGYSTHSVEQARLALQLPIDYLAAGPIFQTLSKADPDAVLGLAGLREIRDATGEFPLVAIGGITAADLDPVFGSGADSAAVIGAVLADPDRIEQVMRKFLESHPA